MDRADFVRRLRRAYARGVAWNWVHWPHEVRSEEMVVLTARVSPRYIHAIERGELTVDQAARAIAVGLMPSLEQSAPYVALWAEAVRYLLAMRDDARRAAVFGRTATDLALEGKWEAAYSACLGAASIEQRYIGRPKHWRPLLVLLDQARSGRLGG